MTNKAEYIYHIEVETVGGLELEFDKQGISPADALRKCFMNAVSVEPVDAMGCNARVSSHIDGYHSISHFRVYDISGHYRKVLI